MTQRQPAGPRAPIKNWLFVDPALVRGNALAFAHGAGDSVPFGLADRASAGWTATFGKRPGEDFSKAFNRQMASERRQDQYEASRYRAARTGGQVAGTTAQILGIGALEGAVLGGSRIAGVAAMIARERKALAAVGAAGGVGQQALSDAARRKLSSPADYVGAAVGGAVEAYTSISGLGSRAGAAGGAASSVTRDLASGRRPSLEHASEAASQGALFGGGLGVVGRATSNALPWRNGRPAELTKGNLGESLSRVRTWARGDRTLPMGTKRKYLEKGGYTYPDHWLEGGKFAESKFGIGIKPLAGRQKQAFEQFNGMKPEEFNKDTFKGPPDYRLDHWLPKDIGAALAFTLSPLRYLNAHEPWPPSAGTDGADSESLRRER